MFSSVDLLRLGTADESSDEVKRLSHYCLELREVLGLLVEECVPDEDGHCEAHDHDEEECPHQQAQNLLSTEIEPGWEMQSEI